MSIALNWDLFIVVFFAIVTAYSFIIGKDQSMKVIIATYISIIVTQGLSNLIVRLAGESTAFMQVMGVAFDITVIAILKIFLFALFIIIFAIKSGVDIQYNRATGPALKVVFTALFGFSTAALIVSTVLTYAASGAVAGAQPIAAEGTQAMLQGSQLMQILIVNQDIWFTLPAFLIIVAGFVHRD